MNTRLNRTTNRLPEIPHPKTKRPATKKAKPAKARAER
jgi:hypothetical protein